MAVEWKPETFVSIYAAIVSTTVAGFQIWNYFHSGVRLRLSVMADGVLVGRDKEEDEKDLIVLTVINRGDAPTQIRNMVILEMPSWHWLPGRKRHKGMRSFIIPNPQPQGYPPIIPFDLEPSKSWVGCCRKRDDILKDVHSGNFYVGVITTNRDAPYLIKVPPRSVEARV